MHVPVRLRFRTDAPPSTTYKEYYSQALVIGISCFGVTVTALLKSRSAANQSKKMKPVGPTRVQCNNSLVVYDKKTCAVSLPCVCSNLSPEDHSKRLSCTGIKLNLTNMSSVSIFVAWDSFVC